MVCILRDVVPLQDYTGLTAWCGSHRPSFCPHNLLLSQECPSGSPWVESSHSYCTNLCQTLVFPEFLAAKNGHMVQFRLILFLSTRSKNKLGGKASMHLHSLMDTRAHEKAPSALSATSLFLNTVVTPGDMAGICRHEATVRMLSHSLPLRPPTPNFLFCDINIP